MRIGSYKELKKFLENLIERKKILLHSCCAPCSTHTILLLSKYFDVTIFYSNDNIYPYDEYQKRLDEQIRFVSNLDNVKVIYDDYKDKDYYEAIKGLEDLGEHSKRCYECYKLRLEKTAIKAKELGFDFFSTTLTISPHKFSEWVNEIGYSMEKKYQIPYLYSDFKKENGYQNSIKVSKEYDLYRQDYCGCVYSFNERGHSL